MSRNCENYCSLLKQANDTIRKMAEWIVNNVDDKLCGGRECIDSCTDCIIKYFEELEG